MQVPMTGKPERRRAGKARGRGFAALLAAVLLAPLAASTARVATAADGKPEDVKVACAGAFDQAQQLRDDAKLLAARERTLSCARPSCPAVVVKACEELLK